MDKKHWAWHKGKHSKVATVSYDGCWTINLRAPAGRPLQMAYGLKVTLAHFVGTLKQPLETLKSSSFIGELSSFFLYLSITF